MPIYYFSLISFPKGHDGCRWDKFTPYVLLVINLFSFRLRPHSSCLKKEKRKKEERRNQRRTYKLLVRTPRNKKVSLL